MKVKRRAPKKKQGVIVGRKILVVSTFYCFFNFFAPWLLLEKQVLQSLYEEFPTVFHLVFFWKSSCSTTIFEIELIPQVCEGRFDHSSQCQLLRVDQGAQNQVDSSADDRRNEKTGETADIE